MVAACGPLSSVDEHRERGPLVASLLQMLLNKGQSCRRECTGLRFLTGDRTGPAGSHWCPHDQAAALVPGEP